MALPHTLSGSDASDASTAETPSLSASDFSLAASDSRVTDDASASVDATPGVTREQMDAVRSQVDAGLVGAVGLDDATVARFIRATGGNLPLVRDTGHVRAGTGFSSLSLDAFLRRGSRKCSGCSSCA